MIRISDLSVTPDTPLNNPGLRALVARCVNLPIARVLECHLRKRSVDARRKNDVRLILTLDARLDTTQTEAAAVAANRRGPPRIMLAPDAPAICKPVYPPAPSIRPVVVGAGPAGLFAALTLAEAGWRSLLVERGAPVDQRKVDVESFWRGGELNPQSNVQFGEGGAGTFSDGKLTTGIQDPRCRRVLETLVAHGAPQEILYQAKPHIGTDRLPQTVKALRERICALGGQVRFYTQLTGLSIENGVLRGITLRTGDNEERLETHHLVLAIGHSARDTFEMLHAAGLHMEQKVFSLGVRIEHAQAHIDCAQYGAFAGHPALGAAEYKLAAHLPGGRSVYTFCMCPGGRVVAASSEAGGICTNGMSAFARDGANANSALLVGVSLADFPSAHPLAGIQLQRELEHAAFAAGGADYRAPAQLVSDLLAGRESRELKNVAPTYLPGITLGDLRACLPSFVLDALREALPRLGRQVRGFDAPGVLLTAPETRSSSPVRILREADGQASIRGLYPTGEGAGYAGGILSAAVDGMKAAERLMNSEQ
ncbi:MAG: FAD-binding protein [Clostridia bacterium]|nr:FAD-binding protein [Clostridia bacterium]